MPRRHIKNPAVLVRSAHRNASGRLVTVVLFNALAEFFAIRMTLVTLMGNVLAVLQALFAITFLDFRDGVVGGRGKRWRSRADVGAEFSANADRARAKPKTY